MKPFVPWRDDRDGDENRMTSILFGVPSLAIGLIGILLLLSLLVGKPIEVPAYYDIALVSVDSTDARGVRIQEKPLEYLVPSIGLLIALCGGAFLGGSGIYLSQTDKRKRKSTARTS